MSHDEAVAGMMADKYLLRELPEQQRDEFEAHYFDCADCADDVRAGQQLIEGIRNRTSV